MSKARFTTQFRFFAVCTTLLFSIGNWAIAANQSELGRWESGLKQAYFGEREIADGAAFIKIEAPKRAEDPALVPLKIITNIPQTSERYIKNMTLIVDNNPDPRAGIFHFTPESGKADLEVRIRVDQYSDVRAIAETNDGKLYMVSRYVKGSGGCSAPAAGDLEAARARMGRMKLQTKAETSDDYSLVSAMLRISHPNITGMQKNQMTQLYYPAHFIKEVTVKLDDQKIFSAELGISISENPSFRFYLTPKQSKGKLTAEVRDSENMEFRYSEDITVLPSSS